MWAVLHPSVALPTCLQLEGELARMAEREAHAQALLRSAQQNATAAHHQLMGLLEDLQRRAAADQELHAFCASMQQVCFGWQAAQCVVLKQCMTKLAAAYALCKNAVMDE
jgi:hypothetical protein